MKPVIQIYKKVGETPLDCIKKLKINHPELKLFPMTYAGRLDPLAEGVLLILVGDECLKKDEYLALPKEYEVEILFGFATDTYDVMGLITEKMAPLLSQFSDPRMREDEGPDHENWLTSFASRIPEILPQFIGQIKQKYPVYSSRPVKGKPLFEWARKGKLDEIEVPSHDIFVKNIEIIQESSYLGAKLLSKIKADIKKVEGDFRQIEIINIWEKELKDKEKEKYPVIKLRISCGSGVYVRGLANDIGEKLGLPALALKIIRTKIGDFNIENCLP